MARRVFSVARVFFASCFLSLSTASDEGSLLSVKVARELKVNEGNGYDAPLAPGTAAALYKQEASTCVLWPPAAATMSCSKNLCNDSAVSSNTTSCLYPFRRNAWKHNGAPPPSCQGDSCCLTCEKWKLYLEPATPQCPCSKYNAGECFSSRCFECKPSNVSIYSYYYYFDVDIPAVQGKPLGYGFLCSGDYNTPTPCCTPNGDACNLTFDNGTAVADKSDCNVTIVGYSHDGD